MPVQAARVECDSCGSIHQTAQPFAIMRGGKTLCEKCANQPSHHDQVYMWITPTLNVTRTTAPRKLDSYEEPENGVLRRVPA